MSPRIEDGFVIVGDEAWLPEDWEQRQRNRAAQDRARRDKMRARSAPGSVRPTVAGRGRPRGRPDPEPGTEEQRSRSAEQEPSRQRSGWGQDGLSRGSALTAEGPARTDGSCRVNLPASTFELLVRSALARAIADDFQAFPSEDRAAWQAAFR